MWVERAQGTFVICGLREPKGRLLYVGWESPRDVCYMWVERAQGTFVICGLREPKGRLLYVG